MCESIFQLLLSSIRKAAETTEVKDHTFPEHYTNQFPYFDVVLVTSDGELVPANRIFLARCPNSFKFLKHDFPERNKLEVSLSCDSVVKVLRVLYSTSCQWLQPSEFEPQEYEEAVRLFGDVTEKANFSCLQEHLETFVCSKLLSDAWIKSGNFKTPVHKVVLCGRSPYFTKAFSPCFLSSKTGETELKGASSPVILALLDYLYSSHVDWATSLEVVVDMLAVANEIQDEVLCEVCKTH